MEVKVSAAKRISGDKALIYSEYENKENREPEVPGSSIAIQYANCYGGSSFFPAGTGGGGRLFWDFNIQNWNPSGPALAAAQ